MDNIGRIVQWQFDLFGRTIKFNPELLLMTWIVMAIIVVLAFFATRNMKEKPGRLQMAFELFYKAFRDLVYATLGEDLGKKYVNYIATLFIFILLSNYLGILPPVFKFFYLTFFYIAKLIPIPSSFYEWMRYVPDFQEPTKFLSTPLGLGLLSAVIVHFSAIKVKGLLNYIKGYMDPLPADGIWLFLFFINPFFYLNVIGEVAKVISHSFRLFGNILGGSIIILIVSSLIKYIGLPVFLLGFFGLFTGAIQAFVFTMLAVTYIAVQVK